MRASRPAVAIAAALFAVGLLGAGPAEARRRFVPREYKTLQKAIDASDPGDTLWVRSGVWHGPFVMKKPLVLFGDGGPDSTILDGGDSTRVLHIEGIHGGAIIGFTIRRGKAVGGGGIQCVRDTLFQVRDCTFDANWEAGLDLWGCQDVNIINITFRKNQGSGLRMNQTRALLQSCRFLENRGYEGGGMSLVESRFVVPIRESTFEGNRAYGSTGGAVNLADSSNADFGYCTFRGNSSAVAGGAIAAMNGSKATISRTTFEKNDAGTGGAIHSDGSGVLVGYSLFDRNHASAAGAAIGVQGRIMANVNPIYQNNTFYRNAVEGEGASIFCVNVSPEIRKNIFVVTKDQKAVGGIEASPLYDCNLIWDPTGGAIGNLPSVNTLVGDPQFCDPDHGDFHMRDLSPALRALCGPVGALSEKPGCRSFQLQPAR
ncbi:MAG: nitrous oxide reductase family maturation protein NosD [Hyphomicrobiales bacterium]